MIEVELDINEMHLGAAVGARRQVEALARGLPDRHGFEGSGWDVHCQGALGEVAVAKALGRFWNGSVNTFKSSADVGDIEVRTRSDHGFDLLVRDNDADDALFVLVTGKAPLFKVWGGIRGRDAKNIEWWHAYAGRPPAYFVPKEALVPVLK